MKTKPSKTEETHKILTKYTDVEHCDKLLLIITKNCFEEGENQLPKRHQ